MHLAWIGLMGSAAMAAAQGSVTFDCKAAPKTMPLTATTMFSPSGTPGFDLQTVPASFAGGACSSDKPFFFSIGLPDGNFRVTVVLGGPAASVTTVRAEARRLMVMERAVAAGGTATQEFTVNVRTPEIGNSMTNAVKLKQREIGTLDWDHKLTLEFNGEHPAVRSITIAPAKDVPTLYLAGDSTVVDQAAEPWAAWGQILPLFIGPDLAVANVAESGETIRSFVGERRLEKIMSTIKAGDYLAIQFGHNDQKPGAVALPDYKSLLKSYISQVRAKGATPILVTSMNRRTFDAEGKIRGTLDEYAAAVREVGAEQKVAVLDLNAMSKTLWETMGSEGTLHAFVHYPANTFPGQTAELKDDTHFNSYGAYELARCIVQSIKDQHLPLEKYLVKTTPAFDPGHPDALASFHLPASPTVSLDTPYGK